MDFSKLRTGELIAGISGVLLLIIMFLPWYGVGGSIGEFASAAGVDTDASAWQAFDFVDLLLFVTALAAIGAAALGATGRSVALPVAASVVVTVLGVVVVLLVLYRIVNQPGPNELVDLKFGVFLGFLVCLGIAAGGFLSMADEGTSIGDAARQVQGGGGTGAGTSTQAAPPPAAPPAGDEPPPPPSSPPPGGP